MKNKILLLVSLILFSFIGFSQPTNDACVNATSLTVNGPLLCGQTTNNATTQTGEHCAASGGGITPKTVWYKFVATSTTMVLNVLRTNNVNCYGYLSVYGPNPTCMPGAGAAILSCVLMNGDPGYYPQLIGLTVGATYFINYNGQGCGGGGDNFHNFCIGIYDVASNNTANGASIINECGTAFNGTTQGGYSATGTGTRRANFDNLATTCGGCTASDDVPWVGNNDSWFYFCVTATSTYNITFNVGSCVFSPPNAGAQMSILTGSPSTGFTNIGNSTNPTASGTSWTSSNFTLNAGQCVYLVVDGFGGDACSYSYNLNVVSGGCVVLPVTLTSFTTKCDNGIPLIEWTTVSELNSNYFQIERSRDGFEWVEVSRINSSSNSATEKNYQLYDMTTGGNFEGYYRLKQVDFDGNFEYFSPKYLMCQQKNEESVEVFPNPTSNEIFIEIRNDIREDMDIQIVDYTGRIILQKTIFVSKDYTLETIDLSKYINGMYYIFVISSQNKYMYKIVKKL
jgi:hypothetical protein